MGKSIFSSEKYVKRSEKSQETKNKIFMERVLTVTRLNMGVSVSVV